MIFREDIDNVVTAIEKAADKIPTTQIDQKYFYEIFDIVTMKGNEGFKEIRIYWGGRWDLILSLEFLHNIECKEQCIMIYQGGGVIIIPYKNIDYVRLI